MSWHDFSPIIVGMDSRLRPGLDPFLTPLWVMACRRYRNLIGRSRFWIYLPCLALVTLACCTPAQAGSRPQAAAPPPCGAADVHHCTAITVSAGDRVFIGGNDDYHNCDSTYWIDPGHAAGHEGLGWDRPATDLA
jgi:hypothetical protein